jgi:hypothetical protein
LKAYENEKKEYAKVLKAKSVEDKAKAVIALNKSTYNKAEILAILRWKLGDEYNTHKDKKVAELQLLLSAYENSNPADILLPPAPEEPSIPHIDETEVGRAKRQQFQMILQSSSGYDNDELQQMANELLRLCVERGVELNSV